MVSTPFRCSRFLCYLALFAAITSNLALAQSQPTFRLTQPYDSARRVTLKGNVHPLAQSRYDQGAVPDSFPAERMLLLLQRSPAREAALRQFIQSAHRLGSPSYHKWLKPEQFGKLYGPDDSDIATVTAWLQSHGFSVARVSKGKTAIEFSGNAGQLREAFNTEIHTYLINGEEHHANDRDPQIPAALAPVVAGITPMNDFHPKSYVKVLGQALYDRSTHKLVPQWTFPSGSDLLDFGPGDFALQYDLNPLYTAGVTGSGVTIGIIGASNVDPTVVATYRSFFGLPASQLNVVIDGEDPGQNYAVVESYLDVELSGAVAPGATINLYTSAGTSLQYGLNLAAQRAVDDDVATVLSTSYGGCEQNLGSAGNQFWAALWEQAAAQGQTSFVSAGDGGPAGCDNFDTAQVAQDGIAVNGIASTPWNVAVGGTDFYYSSYNGSASAQQSQLETYWDTVPTLFPTTSLLQRVPEQPWNEPFGLNISTGGVYNPNSSTIVAGSGGPSSCSTGVEGSNGTYSSCTGGYAKPAWQSGTGVPADGARDLPDVSLFAAAGENDSFSPICTFAGECIVSDGDLTITVVGGTSVSSPAMAGIMALVNQKYGAQGQANFTLYPLAAQHPSAFHDVTVGSNVVPCQPGSPNCTLSTVNDNTKGFYTLGGYYAGPGYDLATGLGSVDANLLVNYWDSLTFKPTTTTLSLSSTTFTHGTPVDVNVDVTGSGGTPSGDVALVSTASPASDTGLGEVTLKSGAGSATVNNLPGGQYQVTARYAGDSVFATSRSTPIALNVAAENSTVSLSGNTYNYGSNSFTPLSNGGSYPYGTYIAIDAQPRGVNAAQGSLDGIATGTLTFADTASSGSTSSGALNLDRTGFAEWVPSAGFSVGTHNLSASYSGDASFNASSSSTPLGFTITKIAPGINLYVGPVLAFRTTTTIGLGTATTLTLIVGITAVAAPPTGTATFYLGNTVLGTATLGPPPYYNPSVSAASLTVNNLPLGTDSVTASYSGDVNYDSGTSNNSVSVVVMQPATVTASANPASLNPLQNFTVTANVSGVNGLPAPTGAVGFYAYGPGGSWSASGTLVNGSASFTFGGGGYWSPGTVSVVVGYGGDSTYAPADVVVPVTITTPFTMSTTPVVIATPGATTGNTSTITVTPASGFTGGVYFACTLEYYPGGAQHIPTCSIPSSVNVTGTSPVTATMTINSTPSTTAALNPLRSGPRWLAAQVGTVMAAFFLGGIPARRRGRRRLASFLVVVALIAGLAGCGGGGSGSGGGGTPVPGTTPGTYTFMVEGSFTATIGTSQPQIAMVNVTIQ
ncbi:MAG: Ig-like domain repeat protein [Terriglobales bacterium]